jgi:toxin ParE1/3/4
MAHRLAPGVEAELDNIWYYIAKGERQHRGCRSLIDSITDRFFLLAGHPYLGRRRDQDLRPGLRSFPVGQYLIFYRVEGGDVIILHVAHGRCDLEALFGD